jgi:hypothetical protein
VGVIRFIINSIEIRHRVAGSTDAPVLSDAREEQVRERKSALQGISSMVMAAVSD